MVEFFDSRGALTLAERARFRRASRTLIVRSTLRALERILESRTFVRVRRHTRDFLAFVVLKRLIGQADEIKEMALAVRVFGESADFNPLENSKVRVAALALRQRLTTYYQTEGKHDPIEIVMPIGTYAPRIRSRKTHTYVTLRSPAPW